MNERIGQLAEEARLLGPSSRIGNSHEAAERFAKLIIKECVGVIEGGRFLHDQAPTALFAKECSGAVKRHFGVE